MQERAASPGFERAASGLVAPRCGNPGSALFSIDAGGRTPSSAPSQGTSPFIHWTLHLQRPSCASGYRSGSFLCEMILRCGGATRTEIRDFAVGSAYRRCLVAGHSAFMRLFTRAAQLDLVLPISEYEAQGDIPAQCDTNCLSWAQRSHRCHDMVRGGAATFPRPRVRIEMVRPPSVRPSALTRSEIRSTFCYATSLTYSRPALYTKVGQNAKTTILQYSDIAHNLTRSNSRSTARGSSGSPTDEDICASRIGE